MTAVLFGSLIWQVIDFLRELMNLKSQKSAVLTQLAAWVGGAVAIFIGTHAAVTTSLVLPGTDLPLGKYDFGSIILVGMLFSSLASTGVDIKQAIDSNDSASKPPLLPATLALPTRRSRRAQAGQTTLVFILIVLALIAFGFGFVVKWLFFVALVLLVVALVQGVVIHPRRRRE